VFKHLTQKKYNAQLMEGMSIQGLITAAAPLVTSSFESDPKARNKRLADCSMLARIKDDSAVGRSEALPRGLRLRPSICFCFAVSRSVGSVSATLTLLVYAPTP
jgi:hypothetical protein